MQARKTGGKPGAGWLEVQARLRGGGSDKLTNATSKSRHLSTENQPLFSATQGPLLTLT